ncbi:hypothetical protein MLD38_024762 [Melastoma candidum]|uniref:Uncharacterized protein n=1 Tax=Melastoma candidum TaxID=119954 RepID=A0ACB9NU94_9MYRT|nr:hypothetical protein MLD38_024762 [Melastoma candidum]
MCPPAAAPVPDLLSHHCSDKELFESLEKFVCGGTLPMNVMDDVNPHHLRPENLPDGLWYFIVLQRLGATEHGTWRATGEPRRIFSNDYICGWLTTYRLCDQHPINKSRADWLMEEYMITQNGIDIKTIGKDATLCRVLQNCPSTDPDLPRGHFPADVLLRVPGNSMDSRDFNSRTRESEASTSNRQVNDIEAVVAAARDNSIDQENMPDPDWEDFPMDGLAIDDLDIPPSPSSSSSNSSCLTMSSNQCFDDLGLQDIENEIIRDMEKKGPDHRFNVSSVRPDGITSYALLPGSSVSHVEEETPTTRNENPRSLAALATTIKAAGKNLLNQGITGGRQNLGNNLAGLARTAIASSSNARQPATREAAAMGEGRSLSLARRQIKMLKKLCLVPFQRHLPRSPGNLN